MTDKQKEFLLLRADGLSYDKIAVKLKISKFTAIQWGRIFKTDIDDLRFQSLATLKEQYQFTKKAKYEKLLQHLNRIDEALSSIQLETVQPKDLWQMRNDIIEQLEQIEKRTHFSKTNLIEKNVLGENEAVTVSLNEIG
ncbi:MAG: hypothetical protein LBQ18_03315 [Campylobacteraceae bacterium]|jgi:transposase|nr:hypothetical protein [Campylobacteraceae bacterium]